MASGAQKRNVSRASMKKHIGSKSYLFMPSKRDDSDVSKWPVRNAEDDE
jgi:hypothetical protein